MYTAITIADAILRLAKKRGLSLTPMQVNKISYIAHGWAFPILGKGLFNDRIEAWKYGPVIPTIYHATKAYGRRPVPHDRIEVETPIGIDQKTLDFLDDVVAKYGHLSGERLSTLTHEPGTPWDQTYQPRVMNLQIPDYMISQYYKEALNEHRSRGAVSTI